MIQGGYYERREAGLGWQVDREQIELRAHFRISEARRAVPELTLVGTGLGDREPVFRGWRTFSRGRPRAECYPRVYIDGMLFSPGGDLPTDIDRVLRPDDVEAIEVFETPWIPGSLQPEPGPVRRHRRVAPLSLGAGRTAPNATRARRTTRSYA